MDICEYQERRLSSTFKAEHNKNAIAPLSLRDNHKSAMYLHN
jgi:hypothetical protein